MAYRISDIFTRLLLSFFLIFAVTLVNAQQKATPKSGEGIAAFLLRHNRSPKKYMDDFLELNKGTSSGSFLYHTSGEERKVRFKVGLRI